MPSAKIGLPIWPHTEKLEKSLAAAWSVGASYVEVSLDYPWVYGLRNEEAKAFRRAVREWGLEVGIHAPWRDVSLASPIREVWEASLGLLIGPVKRVAEDLEAVYLNLHVSTGEYLDSASVRGVAVQAALKALRIILGEYSPIDVAVTVENTPQKGVGDPSFIGTLLDNAPGANLCLDVAHAYAYYARGGEVSTPDALAHWFDSFKGRVKVLHIHDAKRCGPRCFLEHIPPGTGELDWSWLSQKIRGSGADYLLLEVYRDAEGRRITGGVKEYVERVKGWLESG